MIVEKRSPDVHLSNLWEMVESEEARPMIVGATLTISRKKVEEVDLEKGSNYWIVGALDRWALRSLGS
jgi:hypothetical protein